MNEEEKTLAAALADALENKHRRRRAGEPDDDEANDTNALLAALGGLMNGRPLSEMHEEERSLAMALVDALAEKQRRRRAGEPDDDMADLLFALNNLSPGGSGTT